jgi:Mg/Co/Ni transporter MgtE
MQTSLSSSLPLPTSLEPRAPRGPASDPIGHGATAVKVPSWFTAGAALRVAQLKQVEYLLVLDRGAVVGTVGARALASAPAGDPVARSMNASPATVTPETSRREAWRLMACLGLDCLPVTSGMLLVGVVTRAALEDQDQRAAG